MEMWKQIQIKSKWKSEYRNKDKNKYKDTLQIQMEKQI